MIRRDLGPALALAFDVQDDARASLIGFALVAHETLAFAEVGAGAFRIAALEDAAWTLDGNGGDRFVVGNGRLFAFPNIAASRSSVPGSL